MTIRFNVPGARRKELASAIAKKLDTAVSYVGAPSFAYHISDQVLEKDGSLVLCGLDDDAVAGLLSYLGDEGFTPAEPETAITVGGMMPDAVGNLKAMLAAKGYLIKKALGVETLNIETDHDSVTFPWFTREMTEVEKTACTHFLQALCSAAKNQKRASAREKPAENEKYAFRCYLLRLGFIGPQSKTDRHILLRNLAGSAAFKAPRTAAESEAKQLTGISEKALTALRERFPRGARVELEYMNDPWNTKLTPGCLGTVRFVDDIGTVHVAWDCGSSLGVAYGEDSCRRID